MATERNRHRAGAALLVGAGLGQYRARGGLEHVQAVRRPRGGCAAMHRAGCTRSSGRPWQRRPGASGARAPTAAAGFNSACDNAAGDNRALTARYRTYSAGCRSSGVASHHNGHTARRHPISN